MQVSSSVSHDVSTDASSAAQPQGKSVQSSMQEGCSSQLPGQGDAAEVKAKQRERNAAPSTMSGVGMCTRRQDHVGTAAETFQLKQSKQQWSREEEGGPSAVHAQGSFQTECTMPSSMKYQIGELIGEYILYRF